MAVQEILNYDLGPAITATQAFLLAWWIPIFFAWWAAFGFIALALKFPSLLVVPLMVTVLNLAGSVVNTNESYQLAYGSGYNNMCRDTRDDFCLDEDSAQILRDQTVITADNQFDWLATAYNTVRGTVVWDQWAAIFIFVCCVLTGIVALPFWLISLLVPKTKPRVLRDVIKV